MHYFLPFSHAVSRLPRPFFARRLAALQSGADCRLARVSVPRELRGPWGQRSDVAFEAAFFPISTFSF